MNVATFLEHWGLVENPFRAEEARQDAVFSRLSLERAAHPDFEKIVGDLSQPSTSIVFGEKGSGKTAIRLQLEQRVRRHNQERPDSRVLLIPHDDLNPYLDAFCGPHPTERPRKGARREDPTRRLADLRLVDHMDAILNAAVSRIVDAVLEDHDAESALELGDRPARALRRSDRSVRLDLMLLQAVYDRPERATARTAALRRRIRAPLGWSRLLWTGAAYTAWILPAGAAALWLLYRDALSQQSWIILFLVALALWAAALGKRFIWDEWRLRRLGGRVARQLRVLHRSGRSLAESFAHLPDHALQSEGLPIDESDDHRYDMLHRLRVVASGLGFRSLLVVMDRIDEPTMISGDPDRMQAVVWPMLNNKFLQMDYFGVKLLLPIELRHALLRESAAFFQEARLDKQNLVERLLWTGATLYDLCNARLRACRDGADSDVSLLDLFDEDVSRQDVVDALDQMRQPRDAFKFLYQCIHEHCSNVPEEQASPRIPRFILETVRRQQADRVEQFHRGVRPA